MKTKTCPSCRHYCQPYAEQCPECGRRFTNPVHVVLAILLVLAVLVALSV